MKPALVRILRNPPDVHPRVLITLRWEGTGYASVGGPDVGTAVARLRATRGFPYSWNPLSWRKR